MRVAYLIDKQSIGGGMEYIRRQIAEHADDETRVFYAANGECRASVLNAWNADVVHVNHLKALVQLFRNPLVRPKGRVIFTVHGIHLRKYDFLPHSIGNVMKRFLRLRLERWLYHKCDQLIALTPTDADDIRKLYGADLPVAIVPNTVDASEFKEPGRLRYGADSFAFVCIARFDFQKGQDMLLSAIATAQDSLRANGRRTLFIGGGGNLQTMKDFAADKKVLDLVEFAGEIPDAGAYLTCGRVLVAPSRWEGLPYLLLEAVARKRRIIASDCPGNRDVLAGYGDARLFPVQDVDCLARMMEDAE